MTQYIDKNALVEVIRKRLLPAIRDKHYDEWEEGQNSERIAILDIIDAFEVKEVDNVWHDAANETPKGAGDKEILVQFTDSHASVLEIDDWEYLDHQTKWAYLKDLT